MTGRSLPSEAVTAGWSSTETVPIAIAMQRGNWRDSFKPLGVHNYRLYVGATFPFFTNIAGWAMRAAVRLAGARAHRQPG